MDLASIAPATRTVPLGSGTVEITGLSLRKLTKLAVEYPALLVLASGKLDIQTLVVSAPDAVLAIFAVGIVEPRRPTSWQFWKRSLPGAAAQVKAFDEAATGQQIDLLAQIFELTFEGQRAGPFLAAVLTSLNVPASPPDLETSAPTSPPPSPS